MPAGAHSSLRASNSDLAFGAEHHNTTGAPRIGRPRPATARTYKYRVTKAATATLAKGMSATVTLTAT